jgi:polar amino acid transport system substrate-binding protein
VAALIRENPEAYDAAGAPFDADTKIGIAIGKDNPGLKSALQTAVRAVVADGSYTTLLKKWNLAPSSSPF